MRALLRARRCDTGSAAAPQTTLEEEHAMIRSKSSLRHSASFLRKPRPPGCSHPRPSQAEGQDACRDSGDLLAQRRFRRVYPQAQAMKGLADRFRSSSTSEPIAAETSKLFDSVTGYVSCLLRIHFRKHFGPERKTTFVRCVSLSHPCPGGRSSSRRAGLRSGRGPIPWRT